MSITRLLSIPPPLWVIVLLGVILWGGEYALRDLWEPDEARYAYVTGEMAERGDWAVPHRHGVFYAHKPPLMFWLIQASSNLTGGINGISTRLPSLLGALLTLFATTRLAARWAGPGAAWRAMGILLTSYMFWAKGGTGQIDSLLCGLEMSALLILFTLPNDRGGNFRATFAWVLMGLAILAKGPVGLVVPLGVYLAASIAGGEGRQIIRPHLIWGPLCALAVPGIWLLWVKMGNPPEGYLQELLYKQNVERAAGSYGHTKPFYYFLTRFPPQFLPWTLFLPAAYVAYRGMPVQSKRLMCKLAAWVIFVVVFFSISPSKRDLYILCAYPAAAILLAVAWPSFSSGREPRWERRITTALVVLIGLVGCGGAIVNAVSPFLPFNAWSLLPVGIVGLVGGAYIISRAWKDSGVGGQWFAGLVTTIFCVQMAVSHFVYPAVDPIKTPAPIAKAAAAHIPPGEKIILYQLMGEIIALYAERRGEYMELSSELRLALKRQGSGLVVMKESTHNKLPSDLAAVLNPNLFPMGSKELVWCPFDLTPSANPRNEIAPTE